MKKKILNILLISTMILGLTGCSDNNSNIGESNISTQEHLKQESNNITSESELEIENTEERNTLVTDDFTYEHCSFWIDKEESVYFTFTGNDRVKFSRIDNYGWHTTGGYATCNEGIANRGISLIVDEKHIVVVSNEEYRGSKWSVYSHEPEKIRVTSASNGMEIYHAAGDKFQYVTFINGQKICLYTSLLSYAKEVDSEDERIPYMCEILKEVEKTLSKYDGSSFAIDNVAQNELTSWGYEIKSYKNVAGFYGNGLLLQVDDYLLEASLAEGYKTGGTVHELVLSNSEKGKIIISESTKCFSDDREFYEYKEEIVERILKE